MTNGSFSIRTEEVKSAECIDIEASAADMQCSSNTQHEEHSRKQESQSQHMSVEMRD